MFTGLVEEVGTIEKIVTKRGGLSITIAANLILSDLKIGDSVNLNGVCQTVVEINNNKFTVDTIGETLTKTTLGQLRARDRVNLERSLTPATRMGGHFVLGHTDTTGNIISVNATEEEITLTIGYPEKFSVYLANVGSIAIDGISLTVAEHTHCTFKVALIPHTWRETNLQYKKAGDQVNLEFDILGKYVFNILGRTSTNKVDLDMLKKYGFINEEN